VGEIPTRLLSLRPVALEAVEGGNDFSEALPEKGPWGSSEHAGRNV